MDIKKDNKRAIFSKSMLAAIFLIALLLTYFGIDGLKLYNRTDFHDSSAFRFISNVAVPIDNYYDELNKKINGLDSMDESAEKALNFIWSSLAKEDRVADVERIKAETSGKKYSEALWQRLIFANALDGKKIKESLKREYFSMSASEQDAVIANIVAYLKGEVDELDPLVKKIVGKKSGDEQIATLIQSLMLFTGSEDAFIKPQEESIKGLKKTARTVDSKIFAAELAESDAVNGFRAFTITNSKTFLLFACLLVINVIILLLNCLKTHDWFIDAKWILILLIVDFLLVFQLLPMIYMIIKSLFPEGSFTLNTFKRLYTYTMNLEAMRNTLIVAFFTMIFGTLIAFPLAWLVGRTDLYGKKFFRSLFVLTYMVPPYVGAMAWLRLLNPNVGTMNQVLRLIFRMGDMPGPINIYSIGGLIWVLTCFYYPYAFITLSRAMEKMDPSLEEASKISGASPMLTVMKITLPMTFPSLIAGALLVFISAASAYGICSIIGVPGKVHTVTTRIVEYMGLGEKGVNDATGLAVFLMLLSMIILYISDVVIAKKQYITVSGKSTRPTIVELGKWRKPLTVLVSLFAIIVVFIPFLTILVTSFKFDLGKSLFDKSNFTFTQWSKIFSRDETIMCLRNSVVFSIISSTVGIVVAITMSYLLQRTTISGKKIPDFLITLGSSTPSVVVALGLIMTMKGSFGVNIYNTPTIIIVAYLIKYLMMGMRTVVSSMSQIHPSLEECSQISGASWFKTMFKITGPLIFPSIAAGWFLIFIPCFYELSMTTLLYSNTTKTIGYQLYEYWTFHSQPQACAMAFGILIMVVALNTLLNKVTHGEFSI